MKYNFIKNPINNEMYKIRSKLGRKLIKNYILLYGGHKMPCVLNPNGSAHCRKGDKWDRVNCFKEKNKNGVLICKKKKNKSKLKIKKPNNKYIINRYLVYLNNHTEKLKNDRKFL